MVPHGIYPRAITIHHSSLVNLKYYIINIGKGTTDTTIECCQWVSKSMGEAPLWIMTPANSFWPPPLTSMQSGVGVTFLCPILPIIVKSKFLFYQTRVLSLLPFSLTDSPTNSCLVYLIDMTLACEDANSKLVDIVTVADIYIMMKCLSVCHEKWSLPPGSLL